MAIHFAHQPAEVGRHHHHRAQGEGHGRKCAHILGRQATLSSARQATQTATGPRIRKRRPSKQSGVRPPSVCHRQLLSRGHPGASRGARSDATFPMSVHVCSAKAESRSSRCVPKCSNISYVCPLLQCQGWYHRRYKGAGAREGHGRATAREESGPDAGRGGQARGSPGSPPKVHGARSRGTYTKSK